MTEKWKIYELELTGTQEGNPYKDIWVKANLTNGVEAFCVNGFYCGNGKYMVRFMPTTEGEWSGEIQSNDSGLNGEKIHFICGKAKEDNHGRVLPRNEVFAPEKSLNWPNEDRFHFAYEDGTEYKPFGTTCYAWTHQKESVQEATLKELKKFSIQQSENVCISEVLYIQHDQSGRISV